MPQELLLFLKLVIFTSTDFSLVSFCDYLEAAFLHPMCQGNEELRAKRNFLEAN